MPKLQARVRARGGAVARTLASCGGGSVAVAPPARTACRGAAWRQCALAALRSLSIWRARRRLRAAAMASRRMS